MSSNRLDDLILDCLQEAVYNEMLDGVMMESYTGKVKSMFGKLKEAITILIKKIQRFIRKIKIELTVVKQTQVNKKRFREFKKRHMNVKKLLDKAKTAMKDPKKMVPLATTAAALAVTAGVSLAAAGKYSSMNQDKLRKEGKREQIVYANIDQEAKNLYNQCSTVEASISQLTKQEEIENRKKQLMGIRKEYNKYNDARKVSGDKIQKINRELNRESNKISFKFYTLITQILNKDFKALFSLTRQSKPKENSYAKALKNKDIRQRENENYRQVTSGI